MTVAIVSHIVPPMWSGNAVMLHRLLGPVEPERYVMISRMRPQALRGEHVVSRPLPARHHHLTPGLPIADAWWIPSATLRERISILLGIAIRARRIARIVRAERASAIVACSGGEDLLDLPAAYLASRMTGTRYFPYLFDDYEEQWRHAGHRWERSRTWRAVASMTRRLMRGASSVIAPNEFMAEEAARRYGARAVVVRNPCDVDAYPPSADPGPHDGARIVYTGAVYDAHFDAFGNLVAALEAIGRDDVRLHLYSAQRPEDLARHGIAGPVVWHAHVGVDEVPAVQQGADVLFLPLAFDSPYPELVRTSAPGKLGEYLAAGRPILAHVPADSFVAWYLRRHDCGLVVDTPDPAALAHAIEQLVADAPLRERLCANARRRAIDDFGVASVRRTFAELVGL